jgi:hypothetical protein
LPSVTATIQGDYDGLKVCGLRWAARVENEIGSGNDLQSFGDTILANYAPRHTLDADGTTSTSFVKASCQSFDRAMTTVTACAVH